MNMKHGMFLAATLSAGLLAGQLFGDEQPGAATNAPPVIPADQAPPPRDGTKPAKKIKPASKKTAAEKKSAAAAAGKEKEQPGISAGPAVVKQNNVNVRGQAAI